MTLEPLQRKDQQTRTDNVEDARSTT